MSSTTCQMIASDYVKAIEQRYPCAGYLPQNSVVARALAAVVRERVSGEDRPGPEDAPARGRVLRLVNDAFLQELEPLFLAQLGKTEGEVKCCE